MWEQIHKIPWRGAGMFCLGAVGFLHELFGNGTERPFVLAMSGALMGLPFVLSADRQIRKPPPQSEDQERWTHLP